MENKYYDLIISLIKNHRKYPGLESILDDIAKDVLERSKVVVATVTNEDVVKAYLEKTVATSMITVPKKMNLNTRTRRTVRESLAVEADIEGGQASVVLNESSFVNIQEENIVNLEESFVEENLEEDSVLLEEVSEYSENIDYPEIVENCIEESDDINNQEEIVENIEIIEECQEEVETQETVNNVEVVDKALVDRMINGVSVNETVIEEEEVVLSEEVDEVYDTLVEVESIEASLNEVVELVEESENPIAQEVIESNVFFNIEEQTPAFDIDEIVLEQEIEQEVFTNEILESDMGDENINLSLDESEEFIQPVLELEEVPEESLIEEDSFKCIELEQTRFEEKVVEFQPPSFECFSFNPEKKDFDTEEFFSELSDIEKKHPERKIFEVCELKYSQNLSVLEIADKLGFSEEQVLDALNEIIEIVKG